MAARRPRIALGGPQSPTFPLTTVTGLSLADFTPTRQRQVQTAPLLHLERVAITADTPAATTQIDVRLLINRASPEAALKAIDDLWDAVGTTAKNLWFIGDDETDVLVTSNSEIAGSAQVVEYAGSQVSWLAAADYLYYPAQGGSLSEIVVVSAVAATPTFTATLAGTHGAGATCYRVAMCYPDAVLQSIRPSAVPLGKGSLVMSFLAAGIPISGTSLPS